MFPRAKLSIRSRRRRGARSKVGGAKSGAIARVVKKLMDHKQLKFKTINNPQITGFGQMYPLLGPATSFGAGSTNLLLPTIAQGTTFQTRIGDRIRPTSLRVKGRISWNPVPSTALSGGYNTTWYPGSNELLVRVMVVEPKQLRSYNNANALDLLFINTGVPAQITGLTTDMQAPQNPLAYIYHYDKTYRMSKPEGAPTWASATLGVNGTMVAAPTPFECIDYNIKIKTPAHLLYTDDTNNVPSNFAPYLVVTYANPQGSILPNSTLQINWLVQTYTSTLHFEDA